MDATGATNAQPFGECRFESCHLFQLGGRMYKSSQMVLLTGRDGTVAYGKPRHIPMTGFGDYDIVPTEEVEQDEDPAIVAARHERTMAKIAEQIEFERKCEAERKAGSTVHEAGCPCGFCKAGFTRA